MAAKLAHREFLRAFVTRDTQRAEALNDEIPDDERGEFHDLVTAFFSIMLEQRFIDDSSPEAIRTFVEEMRYDYRKAEPPIKPLVIEGLIRAACGEEHLLDEISSDEQLRAQYQVIRKIGHQLPDLSLKLDGFLSDAELLVDSWANEAD